jgi:formate dehydrogenase major subunit
MALVKLEINGKRIIAVDNRTILAVARENGIHDIPTLCHDEQLAPFTSCFVCVVKVKGARSLLPACSTKVTDGMVVETSTPEVRKSRKAALELLVSNHHADCIGPCHQECPAGVDIQGYVALAALGKFREAIRLIKEKNPLPAICGRVCTRPCEVSGCRRNLLDQAVGIDNIKRFIADLDLGMAQPFRPETAPSNGKRVAVVGAGPGGLACAYYLAIRGYAVQIYEAQPEAGGMLRYGIPEYRLPKEVLDSEIGQILDLGVKLSTNVFLGKDFTVAGLKNQGFDAVFLALGAWESSTMRVKNENVAGVIPGIEFLKNVGLRRPVEVSGKVMVVGGGNTAIDCARTALRLGAGEVTLLYRRTRAEMPANPIEIEEAEREGVKLQLLVAPTQVLASEGRLTALECQRMELGEPDASGRRSPKPVRGSEFQIPCDYVIAAIGQSTTMRQLVGSSPVEFAPPGESLKLTRYETVQIDSGTFETTVEGVFAGGDVVTGAATVVEAVAAGRKAAHAIDAFITTGKAAREPVPFVSRKSLFGKATTDDLRSTEKIPHRHMPVLPPEERLGGFAEVELGYGVDDVSRESARCLECGCSAMFSCDLRRLATDYGAEAKTFLGEAKQYRVDRSHPLIELDPAKCILCGRCIRMCSEVVGKSAYGFVNRGFGTIVRPALGGSLLDTDCVSCGLCIGTCPTGAISTKVPLAKPGPWKTTPVVSVCHFCGVGCTIELHSHENTFISPRRIEKSQNTMGGHCRKGLFGFDYVHAADRVLKPRVRAGRDLQETTLDDAVQYTGMRWKELSAKLPGDAMAVFVSPRLTNEEIFLAQKLARMALHTHNVASFANLTSDGHFFPEIVSTATYAELLGAQVIVVLSSQLDREHFVVDLLTRRAVRHGARILAVGPADHGWSGIADLHLVCKPGSEVQALLAVLKQMAPDRLALGDSAGANDLCRVAAETSAERLAELCGVSAEDARTAARLIEASVARVLLWNKDARRERASEDERGYAAFARTVAASYLALREKANMQGLLDMGAHPGWLPGYQPIDDKAVISGFEREWCVSLGDLRKPEVDLATALAEKRIKAALIIGEDPLGHPELPESLRKALRELELLVVADLFMTPTAEAAHVFLPLSSAVETSGTFTNHERRVQRVRQSIQPRNGIETWQLLCQIAGRIGSRFRMKYKSASEITDEICRVVPLYAGLNLDGDIDEAVWDIGKFPLAPVAPSREALVPAVAAAAKLPRPTLTLDHLERRLEQRFKVLFERARQAAQQGTA